ncbi:TetR/AcrR family transcriptional regulator [Halalkalibacterium halodurans]|uniref:HTH tetR-type domain-containing protein n=1 Tax=Halalkalibacterium halodurans TaxID=86665 RepID=A0A0M0KJT7_ALKHA|nr:TetR/AcrR family transcriptional regulator [Halalkalibacterium halodurans]TPE70987.1 TetR/AcrR family transcriptional regulator [Halalkalibacterium halodurans]
MREKERLIIERAMRLFIEKGFVATSIQEIASACGMAKGSLYSYFSSKEDILLAALRMYFQAVQSELMSFQQLGKDPREVFCQQLSYLLDHISSHKEFVDDQLLQQSVRIPEKVRKFLITKHYELHAFYLHGLRAIYGHEAKPYIHDLAIMLDGMLRSYMKILILNEQTFSSDDLVAFLLNRVDDLYQGLCANEEKPMMSEIQMHRISKRVRAFVKEDEDSIAQLIHGMKQTLSTIPNSDDALLSIHVIEEELENDYPRYPVIKGMLSNLVGIKELESFVKELKRQMALK